jgi:hypothetical protein
MKTPQRFMSVNTNVAWKLEGCCFESIDLKNVKQLKMLDKKITIGYLCESCDEMHYLDMYPTTGFVGVTLIGMKIERLMNEWEKYNNYLEKFQYKHSKKETQAFYYSSGFGIGRDDDFGED